MRLFDFIENTLSGKKLFTAAENGDVAQVCKLLAEGADMNATDKDGWTALIYAVRNDHIETVKFLLGNGADVNGMDKYGLTVLMHASGNSRTEMVKLLIEYGADVNAMSVDGSTALIYAVIYNHIETVKLLLECGADACANDKKGEITTLELASRIGHTEIAELLRNWKGSESVAVAEKLPAKDADMNEMKENGWTKLMDTAWKDRTETAKILPGNGADANVTDKDEQITALICAAMRDHTATAELLRNRKGSESAAAAEKFSAKGANVNAMDMDDGAALIEAAGKGLTETVKLLLRNGADVNATKEDGGTALMDAAWKDHTETAKILIEHGADVNAAEKDGWTALMWAAAEGHTEMVKLLLVNGADANATGKDGQVTALLCAVARGHIATAELLRNRKRTW